jgi:peptidoglycan hydrolase-like protein with peptidoglycan-binding domain
MAFSLTWLPDVLLDAGLKVALVDGWENRGSGDVGAIKGVICHHTVGVRHGNMPSLKTLINGRPDLLGPLAQLGLGRDGTFYVIAAGKANHAGRGEWNQISKGNTHFIGIEAENTGGADDFPWPAVQVDACQRGTAAILLHLQLDERACCGHREYALPAGRKPDPTFDMEAFRSSVASLLGAPAAPPLIPAAEPGAAPGGKGRPTLRRNDTGDEVKAVQKQLGVDVVGVFGPKTEAAVRAFQRARGMVPDGIVGPKTWAALDLAAPPPSRLKKLIGR